MSATSFTLNLPGPQAMPLIGWRGNLLRFAIDPLGYTCNVYRRHGTIAALIQGYPSAAVFAFGPTYNRMLLSNPEQFYSRPFLQSAPNTSLARLTSGLLAMNGSVHRQHRKLMMPAFHKKRIEGYHATMTAITQQTLDAWRPGQHLDIAYEMQQLTLRIVSQALFGLNINDRADRLGQRIKTWLYLLDSPQMVLLPYNLPGSPMRRLLRLSDRLEADLQAMIASKRAASELGDDVLAMLIQTRDEDGSMLSEADLVGQAAILFIAGHETSSNALTWTLFLLSQHPTVLEELCDELHGVLRGAAPTIEQLNQLPLLDRVIKESLRLLPPASISLRYSITPIELAGHTIPSGTTIFYSQYITHHMPELYAEPNRFLPSRWETINPGPYEYLPFGAGPRMCIGTTFALFEIKIVLAMLLQRYRLELRAGARVARRLRITLAPRYGMAMIVRPSRQRIRVHTPRGNIHEMVDLPKE